MNDLEDLVREELRAGVAAAEAAHPAEPATALLGSLDRRIRLARLRRRWAASALSAVAVAAAVALPLTLLSPGAKTTSALRNGAAGHGDGSVPLSDPSLTPPGWSPLTYRDAQVSVPSSWGFQTSLGSLCGLTTNGGVLLGRKFRLAELRVAACRLPPTTVTLSPIQRMLRRAPTQRINGIPVTRLPGTSGFVSYTVPSLGVDVTARGPKAPRVIATLTRSPLSVVLAPGRPFPVPSGWRWHDFGGIRFAAPGAWNLQRTDKWGSCDGRPVAAGTVRLSAAATFGCQGGIASPVPLARFSAPVAGLTVGAGRLAALGVGALQSGMQAHCVRLRGMRACIPQEGMPQGGEFLELIIYPPGRARPTVVDIGLAGTGATARTIFDSLRPG